MTTIEAGLDARGYGRKSSEALYDANADGSLAVFAGAPILDLGKQPYEFGSSSVQRRALVASLGPDCLDSTGCSHNLPLQ